MAEQAQAASPFGKQVQGDAYQLMLAKLAFDQRRLKEIQGILLKASVKAEILPDYFDWITSAVQKGNGAEDKVVTTTMVWAVDAGAYALALEMATYVLQYKLRLPDRYERSTATTVIEEFADAYLNGRWTPLKVGKSETGQPALVPDPDCPAVQILQGVQAITAAEDAHDQPRAKLHKAIAYALLGKVQTAESPDLEVLPATVLNQALALLQSALSYDAQSGVKKDIERIERKLAAASAGKVTLPDADAPPAVTAAEAAAPVADTAAAAAEPTPKPDVVNNKTAAKKTATATPKAATARAKPGRKPAAAK
ncbi:small terminase subunit [Comamonas sp. BIGb0124]|nr:small terminase subunit [Comamonas sp. BIGb0124]